MRVHASLLIVVHSTPRVGSFCAPNSSGLFRGIYRALRDNLNKVASVLDVKIMYPISLCPRNFAIVIVVNYIQLFELLVWPEYWEMT